MSTLGHALDYIAHGWSVIPLLPRSKQPALAIGPYLRGELRLGKDEALQWWADGKDYGIAVVTGTPSGIVVIDVDPRNGGDSNAVEATLPDFTTTVKTGGGGRHFYCRYPEGGSVACGKTAQPGVDRKGDGGYVVAPPSIHPNGEPYVLLHASRLCALPAWVTERTRAPETGAMEPTQPWVAATLAAPVSCRPGSQEEVLSRLCWWAARNLDRDIADAILGRWLSALPLGNPHDPWTSDHLTEKLDRAYENRPRDPGAAGALVDDRPAPLGAFERVADLDFPDQQWVVEDFAAPGAFTEIIGKVKKGKSTLTYQLINAVRQGLPFLGRATLKTDVVLLTEQTGTSLKKTLERAGLLGAENVHVMRKQKIVELGGWERAIHAATLECQATEAKLLVVDTLSRLASIGGDAENSSGAVTILDPFGPVREQGVACIFVRHARKGSSQVADEIADAARGSSAITGDMDIVLRITSADDDTRCLSWESRITDDPEDLYLSYKEGIYELVDKPASKTETRQQDDLTALRAAKAKLGDGATRNALAKELGWGHEKTTRLLKVDTTFTHGPAVAAPLEDE